MALSKLGESDYYVTDRLLDERIVPSYRHRCSKKKLPCVTFLVCAMCAILGFLGGAYVSYYPLRLHS